MVTTPNYDLDIDTTLGGANASDYVIPSQKAIKDYVDNHSGGVSIDDITITRNTNDDLEAVGVIDDNSGVALKTWTGTKAEYDAIENKDPDTLYNITDDSVTLPILETLYPVGSIYIGTMSVCPLATLGIGTWQLVAQDKVLQGAGTRGKAGTTLNESLPNITGSFSGRPHATGNTNYGGALQEPTTGAFQLEIQGNTTTGTGSAESSTPSIKLDLMTFNASRSSSTYQDNAPVQQDAYLVNIWERIS